MLRLHWGVHKRGATQRDDIVLFLYPNISERERKRKRKRERQSAREREREFVSRCVKPAMWRRVFSFCETVATFCACTVLFVKHWWRILIVPMAVSILIIPGDSPFTQGRRLAKYRLCRLAGGDCQDPTEGIWDRNTMVLA